MAIKKKGLGRGLDALLSTSSTTTSSSSDTSNTGPVDGELKQIPVDIIQRGKYQPRRDMHPDGLDDLAKSIKAQGVMQPIVVRSVGVDRYEIIAGERRWRASQIAEMDSIPAIIREVPDEIAVAMALIENIQRENLNPIEEAMALQRLIDEFQLTQQEAADAVGKSRTAVTNLLRLISLTDDAKKMLERGDIEMGHARALLTLDAEQQTSLARQVAAKGLTVRQTESLVKSATDSDKSTKAKSAEKQNDPDIRRLEQSLGNMLGAAVAINHTSKGKGKLVIKYNSLEELDGILSHIK